MTVVSTRAKRKLIIVGDTATLASSTAFSSLCWPGLKKQASAPHALDRRIVRFRTVQNRPRDQNRHRCSPSFQSRVFTGLDQFVFCRFYAEEEFDFTLFIAPPLASSQAVGDFDGVPNAQVVHHITAVSDELQGTVCETPGRLFQYDCSLPKSFLTETLRRFDQMNLSGHRCVTHLILLSTMTLP